MNGLLAFLIGFYLVFNWRWLWKKFTCARNEERVSFGLLVFNWALLVWWWSLFR